MPICTPFAPETVAVAPVFAALKQLGESCQRSNPFRVGHLAVGENRGLLVPSGVACGVEQACERIIDTAGLTDAGFSVGVVVEQVDATGRRLAGLSVPVETCLHHGDVRWYFSVREEPPADELSGRRRTVRQHEFDSFNCGARPTEDQDAARADQRRPAGVARTSSTPELC